MRKYELFRKEVSQALETIYQKYFDSDSASEASCKEASCKDPASKSKKK